MGMRAHYKWPIAPALVQRLGTTSFGAQRALFEDGQLLVVLHAPPKAGAARQHEVFLRLPDGTEAGQWMHNGQKAGHYAMVRLLDGYEEELAHLSDALEEADSSTALFEVLGACIPLARAAANLHKALQAARELVKEDAWLIDQRDRAVELARGFELLLADARLELDFRQAVAAEEQARATRAVTRAQQRLNTIAALTFPLMAIGAAFGMNLRIGLEQAWPILFWLVLMAGVVLGLVVNRWMQRERSDAPHHPAP